MSRLLPTRLPLGVMERELTDAQNRLRRFFGPDFDLQVFPFTEPVGWVPRVEIVENDNELILTAELPGMVKDNIEITFEDERLTIQGEKKTEKDEEKEENGGARHYLRERSYGAFSRTFVLPQTIDPAKIAATMKDGILTIQMPKTAVAKERGRKIDITAK